MKKSNRLYRIFIFVCFSLFALSILSPVVWVFLASIKSNPEFYASPWNLPMGIYWQNFVNAWTEANMGDYLLNSVVVTAMALALLLIISIPCAYILARMEFRGKRFLKTFLKAGLFINLSYIVIPIFIMLLDLNAFFNVRLFLNNRFVLALIYASTAVPLRSIFYPTSLVRFPHLSRKRLISMELDIFGRWWISWCLWPSRLSLRLSFLTF